MEEAEYRIPIVSRYCKNKRASRGGPREVGMTSCRNRSGSEPSMISKNWKLYDQYM
jgi:hypothetical protein